MSSIEKLKPCDQNDLEMYEPFYDRQEQDILPYALSLYQQGYLEGERVIEGQENIPFVAIWYVSSLPYEMTRCRIQFQGNAELSYEVNLSNSEFIGYLILLIRDFKKFRQTDFCQKFYRKLLRLEAEETQPLG